MKRTIEILIIGFLVYFAFVYSKYIFSYIEIPKWIKSFEFPNLFDLKDSIILMLRILSILFISVGIIKCLIKKKIELNSIFIFPIYFYFLSYIIGFFRKILTFLKYSSTNYLDILTWFFKIETVFIILVIYFFTQKENKMKQESNITLEKWKRLLNFLLDNFILILFTTSLIDSSLRFSTITPEYLSGLIKLIWVYPTLGFIYYFSFEIVFLRTFGKLATNSIVKINDRKFKGIFVRTVTRFIPFELFSFLINKKGWHDQISNTEVTVANKEYT